MRLKEIYGLQSIVKELEIALQIEGSAYEEKNLDVVVSDVKKRLSRQYALDFTNYKVGDPELEGIKSATEVAMFIQVIGGLHAKLCAYGQIARFLTELPIDLGNVNYLGKEEVSLKSNFKKMERERVMPSSKEFIQVIKDRLGTVSFCLEKRILLLLVVTYELGLYEVTAAIAELLYMSMLG